MTDKGPDPPLAGKTEEGHHGYDVSAAEINILAAVDGAIDKLNRLGIAIRQSSTRNLTARTPAEMSQYNTFRELADKFVKTLYPDASGGLQDMLGRSMADRYQSIISRQARQTQLQQRRLEPAPIVLPAIIEEGEVGADYRAPPTLEENSRSARHQYRQMAEAIGQFASGVPRMVTPSSDASSVNSQLVYRHITSRSSHAGSKKRETSSIQINMVGYPKAPQSTNSPNFITCQWCYETHEKTAFEGDEWRHVNASLATLGEISALT